MSSESASGHDRCRHAGRPDNVCSRCAGNRLAHSGILRWRRCRATHAACGREIPSPGTRLRRQPYLSGNCFRRWPCCCCRLSGNGLRCPRRREEGRLNRQRRAAPGGNVQHAVRRSGLSSATGHGHDSSRAASRTPGCIRRPGHSREVNGPRLATRRCSGYDFRTLMRPSGSMWISVERPRPAPATRSFLDKKASS